MNLKKIFKQISHNISYRNNRLQIRSNCQTSDKQRALSNKIKLTNKIKNMHYCFLFEFCTATFACKDIQRYTLNKN